MLLLNAYIKQMLALALLQHVSKCSKVIMTCPLNKKKSNLECEIFHQDGPSGQEAIFKVYECSVSSAWRPFLSQGHIQCSRTVQDSLDFRRSPLTVTPVKFGNPIFPNPYAMSYLLRLLLYKESNQSLLPLQQIAFQVLIILESWALSITKSTGQ